MDSVLFDSRSGETADGRITIAARNQIHGKDTVDLETLNTDAYSSNPVVLLSHRRGELPIAKTLKLERIDGQLVADFRFNRADPLAMRVKQAWDQGYISGASIGWDDKTNSLKEWSLVSVPADPDVVTGRGHQGQVAPQPEVARTHVRLNSASRFQN